MCELEFLLASIEVARNSCQEGLVAICINTAGLKLSLLLLAESFVVLICLFSFKKSSARKSCWIGSSCVFIERSKIGQAVEWLAFFSLYNQHASPPDLQGPPPWEKWQLLFQVLLYLVSLLGLSRCGRGQLPLIFISQGQAFSDSTT